MPARGSAEWKGDLRTGTGTFTAGDTISGEYSFKSRFEDGPGANPEQLIAAAHASCFSMALSNILAEAGTPPDSVRPTPRSRCGSVDGAPTITTIDLVTVGQVPGIDEATFQRARRGGQGRLPGQPRTGRRAGDHPRRVPGAPARAAPPAAGPGWIEAVVFDLDGVLIDSEPVREQVRRQLVAEHGGHWAPDSQRRIMGMSTGEWARYLSEDLGVGLPVQQVAELVVERMAARYADQLPLVPGAVETVRRLAAAGRSDWPVHRRCR